MYRTVEILRRLPKLARLYCQSNPLFNSSEAKKSLSDINEKIEVNPKEEFGAELVVLNRSANDFESSSYRLETMCKLIEGANSMPSKAPMYLEQLKQTSKMIKKNLHKFMQIFSGLKEGTLITFYIEINVDIDESNDSFDYFIQNIQMLAETDNNYHDQIVSILK